MKYIFEYCHLLDHCYSRPYHGGQAVEAVEEVDIPAAGVEVEVMAAKVAVEAAAEQRQLFWLMTTFLKCQYTTIDIDY